MYDKKNKYRDVPNDDPIFTKIDQLQNTTKDVQVIRDTECLNMSLAHLHFPIMTCHWKGEEHFNSLLKNRSPKNIFYNCACGKSSLDTEIEMMVDLTAAGLCSGMIGENAVHDYVNNNYTFVKQKVKLFSLNDILEKENIKELEELHIDVEGFEIDVLLGIDKKTKIKYCEVELHKEKDRETIIDLCENLNLIYVESRIDGCEQLIFKEKDND
mgnify:CR=1 FL=1